MEETGLVPVGRIIRPHGVGGGVKIYPYGETLALRAAEGSLRLHLQPEKPGGRAALTVLDLRPQKGVWLVRFAGITTREEAEDLVGKEVFLPREELPPPEDGEYYHFQLIGLAVETKSGRALGTLTGIIETGANDVFVVQSEGREFLIPAVEDVVCEVDLEKALMVIDPPEGLIDDP